MWWCLEHRSVGRGKHCRHKRMTHALADCRMVDRLLVDPDRVLVVEKGEVNAEALRLALDHADFVHADGAAVLLYPNDDILDAARLVLDALKVAYDAQREGK